MAEGVRALRAVPRARIIGRERTRYHGPMSARLRAVVLLSGGLDSSLVTVTAQQATPEPLRTFTITFEHSEFDEAPNTGAASGPFTPVNRDSF